MAVKKDEKTKKWFFYGKHPDGKQYKRRGFDTKKEAQMAEMKYLDDYDAPPETKLLLEVAAEYIEWYEARRKLSSTTKIKSVVNTHVLPTYGELPITEITARHVMDHQTKLIMNGYAGATCEKIHAVTSAIFKFAIRSGYIKENPASVAGGPEIKKNRIINYWTLDEFKQFLTVVDDDMHYALFMTLYYSGMRKGEARALLWSDIDFENGTISITKTEYKRFIQTPKTASSIRTIHMPQHVMRLLDRLKTSRKAQPNYSVFGEYTTSIAESVLTRAFHRYVKESDVKKIRIHDFRHSHASYLINKGIIASVVAARLGHSDVSTTLNIYSHLFPSTEKEAVLGMEDDFKKADIVEFKAR